ncbi:Adenylosuccinate lyase [Granulibacter bethesdensis]|nr:Adenylosuccinate lyase [Granulibacter bethesdensis]
MITAGLKTSPSGKRESIIFSILYRVKGPACSPTHTTGGCQNGAGGFLPSSPPALEDEIPIMVPRYTRPIMAAIWAPENRYRIWFEIEALAAEAMAQTGMIPEEAARTIRERGNAKVATITQADLDRIDAIEAETRHDVIAFLTWLAEGIGPDSRFVHQGMTSSDVLDTCLSVQMTQAADILLADLDEVLAALKARAIEFKYTPTIGRSHGIHAEPTSFGLKLAGHYAEFARNRKRLEQARAEIATCAISGAVGTYAHLDPRIEAYVAEKLGLSVEPVSTQVIPRDRHAAFFCTLAVIASGIERLAIEVRHLQRSEVREAEEFFHAGQKGSSAMPHKRNPVLSENLTGLARVVRAAAVPALENVALWHERDISHSSVERAIGPDATVTLDFALARLAGMMAKLTVYPDQMSSNLESLGGVVHSGEVLLALTRAGILREDAYRIVQRNAMATWTKLGLPDARGFRDNLLADPEVAGRITAEQIDAAMDPSMHLKHVDTVFARLFG